MKLVQITDIHLFGDRAGCMAEWPGRPTLQSLSLVLDDILRRVPDLDALVVSGDVADSGLDEGAYVTLRRELEHRGLLERTHVIPGNHDRRAPLLAAFPECECTHLDGDNVGQTGDELVEASFAASVHTEEGEWRLIGLDSGGTSSAPTLSAGQLQLLARELADTRHDGKRTLLFMHHSPVAVGHFFDSPFTDTVLASLESTLHGSRRVEAILAGHNHYECKAEFVGLQVLVSPSTTCQYATNPSGEWMVASAAADHTHIAGIDPQAPAHHPANPLMVPGYRIVEGLTSGLRSQCIWVPSAASVGAAAAL
jgi:Icc protein